MRCFHLLFCVAASSAVATGALAANDRDFLRKALQGDNSEMALGQMAVENGTSPGVRDLGRMLREDHGRAKAAALPVAQAHGVRETDAMAPEAIAERRKLNRLHGMAFDHEFARYMVKDHRKDIADFEKASHTGDRATADLARATLPDLRKHLQLAEQLMRR